MTYDSLMVTQVQDETAPYENSNAYIVTSTVSLESFFVDTGATESTTSKLISLYQQQVKSTTKPPQFVFLTHGHPDHTAGIALIQRTYPSTPFYVISQQIIAEAKLWNDFVCSLSGNTAARCQINMSTALTVLKTPQSQLVFNHSSVSFDVLSVIAKTESAYASLLGMKISTSIYLLFTGDFVTIRTHLFVSNYFDTETLPDSDDALCAWAGSVQETICNLRKSKYRPVIFPGHGPVSGPTNYVQDISRNIAWLRALRNMTFNSCNATYIWAEMIRQYPDFGGQELVARGALGTHVPADANSFQCNCNNSLPNVCPVYNTPPTCIHLDMMNVDTTLACRMQPVNKAPTLTDSILILFFAIAFFFDINN